MQLTYARTELGLIYIDTLTNESYWTPSSFSNFSGIHRSAIDRAIRNGRILSVKTAELPSEQGFRNGRIFLATDKFALEQLAEKRPALAVELMGAGANEYLHKLAGYEVVSTLNQEPINQRLLEAMRELAKAHHPGFQAVAELKRYSLARTHDYLTKRLYNLTAEEARKLPQVVAGLERVGLNHVGSADHQELVAKVKRKFVQLGSRTFASYKEHIDRAIALVLN